MKTNRNYGQELSEIAAAIATEIKSEMKRIDRTVTGDTVKDDDPETYFFGYANVEEWKITGINKDGNFIGRFTKDTEGETVLDVLEDSNVNIYDLAALLDDLRQIETAVTA